MPGPFQPGLFQQLGGIAGALDHMNAPPPAGGARPSFGAAPAPAAPPSNPWGLQAPTFGAPAGMRPAGPAPMPTFGQSYQNPMQQQVARQLAPSFFDRLRNNPQLHNMGLGMLAGRQQGMNVGQMMPQIMSLWNGGR